MYVLVERTPKIRTPPPPQQNRMRTDGLLLPLSQFNKFPRVKCWAGFQERAPARLGSKQEHVNPGVGSPFHEESRGSGALRIQPPPIQSGISERTVSKTTANAIKTANTVTYPSQMKARSSQELWKRTYTSYHKVQPTGALVCSV